MTRASLEAERGSVQRSGADPPTRPSALALVGILALAAVILTVPAGRRIFWSSDESRFALLAQDILDHGRWLVPELRGQLYLNKPQLQFWAIALVSLPAGRVTELTAAIPAIVSALAAVAGVAAIATLLWGRRAGLMAGLILATVPPLFAFGHVALPDMMLGSWMVWSLYWFLRAQRSGWVAGPLAGFYACVGLAVASKGPPGYAALAGGLVAVVGTEGARGLARLRPALGLLILALCAIPWIVPYHLESRGEFASTVLVDHYMTWYFRGGLLDRLSGTGSALANFFPWVIFLAAAPWWWRRAPDPGRRAVGLWTLTVWVWLGFSGTLRARYLLPVYPLFALLTAEFVARGGERGGGRPLRAAAAVFCASAIGVAVALIVPPPWVFGAEDAALFPEAPWERALMIVTLVLGGAVTYGLARRGAFDAMVVAVAVTRGAVVAGAGGPHRGRARDGCGGELAAVTAAVDLSIVIPVYDEVANLRPLWLELDPELREIGLTAEVIFVDDGSTDGGTAIIRELVATDKRLRLIRFAANAGLTAAFYAGLRAARGEIVVTMDADIQNDPNHLAALLRP